MSVLIEQRHQFLGLERIVNFFRKSRFNQDCKFKVQQGSAKSMTTATLHVHELEAHRKDLYDFVHLAKINKALKYIKNDPSISKESKNQLRDILCCEKESKLINQNVEHLLFYDEVFLYRLLKKYPDLTDSEVRICGLISEHYSTKEIALILDKSYNSIKVIKSRIRKKLEMKVGRESLLSRLLKIKLA